MAKIGHFGVSNLTFQTAQLTFNPVYLAEIFILKTNNINQPYKTPTLCRDAPRHVSTTRQFYATYFTRRIYSMNLYPLHIYNAPTTQFRCTDVPWRVSDPNPTIRTRCRDAPPHASTDGHYPLHKKIPCPFTGLGILTIFNL